MTIAEMIQRASIAGTTILLLAGTAAASVITFSTDAPGTGFNGASLILNNSAGVAATLTFIPNVNVTTGVPSNVNFGNFTLVCPTCSTQATGTGSVFPAFVFNLVITDVTNGNATGTFAGTSTGGAVFSDVSQLAIAWAPLQLGPGTNNASSGDFGPAIFTTTIFTGIVAPNSGEVPGQSTVQGAVDFEQSSADSAPEPATLGLVGGLLVGIGLLRARSSRQ